MKEESYRCDLCKKKRDKDNVQAFLELGGRYVLLQGSHPRWLESDCHVCQDCIRVMKGATQ
ncbi:MAG: hypothetical protein IAF94_08600 [Pirellulaceae bacterium]|nr:hypothetical protein [Pirellulaceae bacterium]